MEDLMPKNGPGYVFGPKVSVEIDGSTADMLLKLAREHAFGKEHATTSLNELVEHLLSNRVKAGKRKLKRMRKALADEVSQESQRYVKAFEELAQLAKERQPQPEVEKKDKESSPGVDT